MIRRDLSFPLWIQELFVGPWHFRPSNHPGVVADNFRHAVHGRPVALRIDKNLREIFCLRRHVFTEEVFLLEKVSLSVAGLQNVKVMPPRLRFGEDLRQKPLADGTVDFDLDEGILRLKGIDDQLHL